MRRPRRTFSPEFRAKVTLAALKGDRTAVELAEQGELHPNQMAIPVLHGMQGVPAAIVEHEGIGLLFKPENPEALVNDLRRLADDPELLDRYKANGPVGAQRYDRSALALKMLDILMEKATRL